MLAALFLWSHPYRSAALTCGSQPFRRPGRLERGSSVARREKTPSRMSRCTRSNDIPPERVRVPRCSRRFSLHARAKSLRASRPDPFVFGLLKIHFQAKFVLFRHTPCFSLPSTESTQHNRGSVSQTEWPLCGEQKTKFVKPNGTFTRR